MRIPVPADSVRKILDTNGRVVGLRIQNASATDVYTSDTEGALKDVDAQNAPLSGERWGFGMNQPAIIPRFNGVLYARAVAPTSLEITQFEVEECRC